MNTVKHEILSEHLERAEDRLRAAYSTGDSHFTSMERVVEQTHINRSAVDSYTLAHVDKLDRTLKECKSQADARRILATMVLHYLSVGAMAQRLSEGRNW